jgi:hypothetical protein
MVDDATAAAGYAANKKAFELGQALPDNTAAGIRSRRQAVFDAFDQLKEDIKNALNPKKEQVKLIGELFSKELANGLRNGDPVVRAQAREARTAALNELQDLIASGAPIGKKTTAALAKGLRSRDPKVRETARQLAKIIDGRFDAAAGPAHSSGVAAGNAFANGVRAAITARMQAGINIHVNAIYSTTARATRSAVVHGRRPDVGQRAHDELRDLRPLDERPVPDPRRGHERDAPGPAARRSTSRSTPAATSARSRRTGSASSSSTRSPRRSARAAPGAGSRRRCGRDAAVHARGRHAVRGRDL